MPRGLPQLVKEHIESVAHPPLQRWMPITDPARDFAPHSTALDSVTC